MEKHHSSESNKIIEFWESFTRDATAEEIHILAETPLILEKETTDSQTLPLSHDLRKFPLLT
jgi:hypothetical protein